MIWAGIFLAHLVGDYIFQGHYMATYKTERSVRGWTAASLHGIFYTVPFLFLTQNPWALLIIAGTHILIDHYRLAIPLSWLKNQLAPPDERLPWSDRNWNNGYPPSTPVWMSTWLMIITDNTLHLLIAFFAIAVFR